MQLSRENQCQGRSVPIYLPIPTSLHVKWAVLAAEKKKHVLLEKPVALNVGEFDRIAEACEANGVQFMDGTFWMHHPRTVKMREFLSDSNLFGQLKTMHSCFTFAANSDFLQNDIRVKPDLDALGDIGWYCIRSMLWAADFELPKTVSALGTETLFKELSMGWIPKPCEHTVITDLPQVWESLSLIYMGEVVGISIQQALVVSSVKNEVIRIPEMPSRLHQLGSGAMGTLEGL